MSYMNYATVVEPVPSLEKEGGVMDANLPCYESVFKQSMALSLLALYDRSVAVPVPSLGRGRGRSYLGRHGVLTHARNDTRIELTGIGIRRVHADATLALTIRVRVP